MRVKMLQGMQPLNEKGVRTIYTAGLVYEIEGVIADALIADKMAGPVDEEDNLIVEPEPEPAPMTTPP